MATNVTQKDETLKQVIDYCEKKISDIGNNIGIIADNFSGNAVYDQMQGQVDAYEDIALKCINALGRVKEDDTNGD